MIPLVRPRLLLATRNRDKVREIREALDGLELDLVTIDELGPLPEVIEDQETLKGNAIKKAATLASISGLPALADDTGLEVDVLHGAPGVFSSRYSGENATYAENVSKLLREMAGIPAAQRTARFRCVIAIAGTDRVDTVDGVCEGLILAAPQGTDGFGYDPVFMVPGSGKTFAELPLSEKNRISHRGRALKEARKLLKAMLERGELQAR
ncbi:MAG TPA: XTP/dITP diphosphatase [bacterium]|nr:XTP/dITP diphosphatase [bacterium]HQG44906.1 XTP/dITP diphosphatase [bacterium]HQI49376.1 XTP/dITP diphosphatase [bacterium]HQJ66238.1 XTP/dITP diphosphatase [bacterium]